MMGRLIPRETDSTTDDSERAVERLLDSRPSTTDSTLASAPSRNISTPPPTSLPIEKSPGYKWKQTVLIPADATRLITKSALLLNPSAHSPRTLTRAGWDTASSDIEQ